MKDIITKARDVIEYERDIYTNILSKLTLDRSVQLDIDDCRTELHEKITELIKACDNELRK